MAFEEQVVVEELHGIDKVTAAENPSISELVSSYMLSLRRHKVFLSTSEP